MMTTYDHNCIYTFEPFNKIIFGEFFISIVHTCLHLLLICLWNNYMYHVFSRSVMTLPVILPLNSQNFI